MAIKEDVTMEGTLKNLLGEEKPEDMNIEMIREKLLSFKRNRATHKRKVTMYFNSLETMYDNSTLNTSLCKKQLKAIDDEVSKINYWNEVINTFSQRVDYSIKDEEALNNELDSQAEYNVSILVSTDKYEDYITSKDDRTPSTLSIKETLSEGKPPPLNCSTFSGNEKDKFAFHNFLIQFNNVIDSRRKLSDSAKLSYLVGYLKDYALKQIRHLSITDTNYKIALDLLKEEFLDKAYIIDETLKNILKAKPGEEYSPEYLNVKYYISEIRAYLYELKQYEIDFLEEGSSGNILISHIIMTKLPKVVVKELINKVNNNYPNLKQIFDNYRDILKTLTRTLTVKNIAKDKKNFSSYDFKHSFKINPKDKVPTVQNFKVQAIKKSVCKLCSSEGHYFGKCETYPNYEAKLARILELSLCTRCAGSGHNESECYGKKGFLKFPCLTCKKKEHVTSLCPTQKAVQTNLCYALKNTDTCNMLPTMTLNLKCGHKQRQVRCLIDCGSQRSFITKEAALALSPNYNELFSSEHEIHSYLGRQVKKFKQMSTGVKLKNRMFFVPLLVDESMNINYTMHGMKDVINKLKLQGVNLLDESFYLNKEHDTIEIDMLMGIDIIQYLSFSIKKIGGGYNFIIDDRVAPIGNIFNFLSSAERNDLLNTQLKPIKKNNKTVINLIMDPLKSYFNPLENILSDSEVDNGLENLFSLESMGIRPNDQESISFDNKQISKFREGIKQIDGHYYIELPWYPDRIEKVPSNHFIALKVLDRTMNFLNERGLTKKYDAIFSKQLEDGIIEQIEVNPSNYYKYTWIPHRPVLKTAEQVTTKIRPVFNCSLKTNKELPSINEAAYTGIDLMGSLLKLLLYFRSNKYVMLGDIKQAFLMIKLSSEYDKNRFCFFWRRENKLICYRYKTIVFGYTSSPFILHYVMNHHVKSYPQDKCSKILGNNFYVDNLVVTGNNINEMQDLYKKCFVRMQEGGFTLRSWNSNSDELRNLMKAEGRLVEHGCQDEKVLGYRYNTEKDSLSLAPFTLKEAYTKRLVLSQISKVYDPLNFTLPVSIRGRVLMRKIWKLNINWDEKVPKEISDEMKIITRDFEMLPELSFPRAAINDNEPYGLHIFCDSSTEAYGFVIYACSNENTSSFLFAKSKLSPLRKGNELSVPTLELMGVILALKCLPTLIETYENIQFQFINICVDAQVVLNWLITKESKVKSKFVKNRISEVNGLIKALEDEFKLPIMFHYVHTDQNPADMLTRGISYDKYLRNRKLWLEGPSWLTNEFKNWPKYPLMSISPDHKGTVNVNCNQIIKTKTAILDIEKYSDYNKLLRITSLLFKPFCKKKNGVNPLKKAKMYWIRLIQNEHFFKEIDFLKSQDKSNKNVPTLVSNLNLFIDSDGILRSQGRISKCLYFNYEVYNPVLLPKRNKFTSLFINYCHAKVQHMGIGTTLNYLREQGVWIPQGLTVVKAEINNCSTCKKYNALAYKYPKVVDMPRHHVNLVKPFNHVGIDYTGHLWVKNEVGGSTVKMFVLIFTCLNIRAVHFELLPDMSTRNFMLAFQRFCNMYSVPQFLYSDNAKTFKKAGCILESSLQSKTFQEELEKLDIRHIKIPLYSAWVGSAWERLIRVLKGCLFKVIGRSRLSYFELLTTLSNIKLAINSRPLTYRLSSPNLEIITPNSFLRIYGNSSLVLKSEEEEVWQEEPDSNSLNKTLNFQEEIILKFKLLWYESYLLSLREHGRNIYQNKWENRIKVGDVVLIKSTTKSRPFWMLGKVLENVIGFDNKIRAVKLKQGNGAIEYHSISNLYPMEISCPQGNTRMEEPISKPFQNDSSEGLNDKTLQLGNSNSNEEVSNQLRTRPKRKASAKFYQMMKDNIDYL